MTTEKCDLCGAEVRHTHPAMNRETNKEAKICCACRDNSSHPIEDFIKDATPGCTHYRIPCVMDELLDLSDEQLVDLYARTMAAIHPGIGSEEMIRATGTAKSIAIVLDGRGKGYLLEDMGEKAEQWRGAEVLSDYGERIGPFKK